MLAGFDGILAQELDEAIERTAGTLTQLDGASIFLTGGTGFFGKWILALLTQARLRSSLNLQITVLSRSPERFARLSPDLAHLDFVRLFPGDVRSFVFPKGRYTHVIHAATDTTAAAGEAMTLIAEITEGTRRVLEFAAVAGVQRLLYVSSGDSGRIPRRLRLPRSELGIRSGQALGRADVRPRFGRYADRSRHRSRRRIRRPRLAARRSFRNRQFHSRRH